MELGKENDRAKEMGSLNLTRDNQNTEDKQRQYGLHCTLENKSATMSKKHEASQIHDEVESLTMHGISRVASAKNKYTRTIWLGLCLAAGATLMAIAAKSLVKYFEYQVMVNVYLKPNSILALPAITFCQTNYYRPDLYSFTKPPVFQDFPKSCNQTEDKYFATETNKDIFNYACKIFFGNVTANTIGMSVDIPRYIKFPENFSISPRKYPCITLNRNSTLVQYAAGQENGLNMIMYNQELEKFFMYETKEMLNDKRDGMYVMLHDPAQLVPYDEGIVIPPGFHTHISVKRNRMKRLPSPYPSKCLDGGSDHDSIYPGKNTQQMCYTSCALKMLYRLCHGVLPEMSTFMNGEEFPKKADIKNGSFWKCLAESIYKLFDINCNCRLHCHELTYTVVANRNPWPQKWQVQSFAKLINSVEGIQNRSLSHDQIRQRLMKVSIYYDDFSERIYQEKALYDLDSLAGNIGGLMGLFLGASLLSLAEIFEMAFSYIKRKVFRGDRMTAVVSLNSGQSPD